MVALRVAAFGVLSLMLLSAWPVRADEADGFRWGPAEPSYPPVAPLEWAVGGTSLAAAIGVLLFWQPTKPHFKGPILFDRVVRDALLVEADGPRQALTVVSEVSFYMLLFLPTLLDAGVVVAGVHERSDVAAQMVGMNLLAYGTAALLAYSITTLAARERPFVGPCRTNPDYDSGCGVPASENASFFSGHATAAFAGAGVTCAHHAYLPIYGGWGDPAACGAALAMATGVAVLRVATDNHYATDVLVGSAVGLGVGYGLPYLLHYQHAALPEGLALLPQLTPGAYGLSVAWSGG